MVNRIVNVEWTSTGATRVTKAMSDIDKAATRTAASTTTSGNRINSSFQKAASGGGGVKGLASAFGGLASSTVVTGAALYGVTSALKSVVNAGREQERATRLTQAVLQSTGGAAGVTAQQVEDLASKLSLMSGVQDEVIQHGENVLLTFRSVRNEAGKGNDIFTQGTKAALDLSAALGQDLQSSVIQLGKALNDPIVGMTALRRVGVSFTEQQKEQIKALTESGHLLEAQKVILSELTAEFGGAAAAAADPFSKLNASVNELKESLGTAIIPQVSTFVGLLNQAVKLANQLPKGVGGGSTPSGGVSLKGLPSAGDPLAEVRATFKAFFFRGPLGVVDLKKRIDEGNVALKRLAQTTKEYNAAVASGNKGQIIAATKALANAYFVLHPELRAAKKGLDENASAADIASIAYAGLGANVNNAADALAALENKAFAGIKANIAAGNAQQNFNDAIQQLEHPDTGSSGGGSKSTETATAAALNRADKESTLRDAIQGVTDADKAAKDAQTALTDARKTYETVLHGVAAGSREAKAAEEAYAQAQDAAKSSVLDLRDANRQLADAIDAQRIAQREANEALGSANRSRASARLDLADAKLNLADAIEGGDPEEIARAQITLGEAQQRLRDATESVARARKDKTEAGKKDSKADDDVKRAQIGVTEAAIKNEQATRDLNEAHRILQGTLHGFPSTSKEAQDTLHNLQDALHTAREATDTLHDSSTALQRAQADLAGKLDAVGSSAASAGKKVTSFAQRLRDAKTAGIELANAAIEADAAVGHSFSHSILVGIEKLKELAAANPLLAAAFSTALRTLEEQFVRAVSSEAFKSGTSIVPGGPGHAVGRDSHTPIPAFDKGGLVPGAVGSPQLILAHGGETVVPPVSLRNSRPFGGGGVVVQEIHYHHTGPLIGNEVEAWLEKTMASARRNGRDLDRRR